MSACSSAIIWKSNNVLLESHQLGSSNTPNEINRAAFIIKWLVTRNVVPCNVLFLQEISGKQSPSPNQTNLIHPNQDRNLPNILRLPTKDTTHLRRPSGRKPHSVTWNNIKTSEYNLVTLSAPPTTTIKKNQQWHPDRVPVVYQHGISNTLGKNWEYELNNGRR